MGLRGTFHPGSYEACISLILPSEQTLQLQAKEAFFHMQIKTEKNCESSAKIGIKAYKKLTQVGMQEPSATQRNKGPALSTFKIDGEKLKPINIAQRQIMASPTILSYVNFFSLFLHLSLGKLSQERVRYKNKRNQQQEAITYLITELKENAVHIKLVINLVDSNKGIFTTEPKRYISSASMRFWRLQDNRIMKNLFLKVIIIFP